MLTLLRLPQCRELPRPARDLGARLIFWRTQGHASNKVITAGYILTVIFNQIL